MSSGQIVECAPCYELKYDENIDSLRDLTFSELKTVFGKNNKIKCNCWSDRNREYKVESAFIATHIKSQKHINWREEQSKKHKKSYGHCISSEKIIETQRKELRDYKKLHANSIQLINNKDEKLNLLSNKLEEVSLEKDSLQNKLDEHEELEKQDELEKQEEQKELEKFKKELEDLKMIEKANTTLKHELANISIEMEIMREELEEYQKDIITITHERDKLKYELTSKKLMIVGRKNGTITPIVRKAFR